MSSLIVAEMMFFSVLDCIMCKFVTNETNNFRIVSKKKILTLIFCLILYLSGTMPLFWRSFEVNLNESEKFWKNYVSFKIRTFCMMNQGEKICREYQPEVRCFQEIPYRFEFEGSDDKKSCSVILPPGYSIYVEEFILNDPGPDNFVLIDGNFPKYRPKLKWEDRGNIFWKKIHHNNPLNKKSTQRSNLPCVSKLKVN